MHIFYLTEYTPTLIIYVSRIVFIYVKLFKVWKDFFLNQMVYTLLSFIDIFHTVKGQISGV